MNSSSSARALAAALLLTIVGTADLAHADTKDYEFQLVDPTAKVGPGGSVAVRLINKVTGKPVPDALIFASRLDMAPDGMEEMTTKVTPEKGDEPGVYRFKANISMAGRWRLSLGAKVQGETGTLESKLVIQVQK